MSKNYRLTEYPSQELQGEEWQKQFKRYGYYTRFLSVGFPQRHIDNLEGLNLREEGKNAVLTILSRRKKGALCLLAGRRGNGKTQLATFLAVEWFEALKSQSGDNHAITVESSVRYVKALDLIREMTATWKRTADESEDSVLKRYQSPSLLIIDEVAELRGNEVDRSIFVNLIDHRYDKYRSTILIGNIVESEIGTLIDPSILSRMEECGGLIELKGESFRI